MISSSLDILYLFCMIIQRYCCHEIVEHILVYLTHLPLFYRSSIKHASATGGHMQTSLCGLCLQTWNAREHSTQHGVNEWRTGRCLELTKLFRVSGNINFHSGHVVVAVGVLLILKNIFCMATVKFRL